MHMALCLSRNELDDLIRHVDARPVQPTAIPKAQTSVYANENEFVPFPTPTFLIPLLRYRKYPFQLLRRKFSTTMAIVRILLLLLREHSTTE